MNEGGHWCLENILLTIISLPPFLLAISEASMEPLAFHSQISDTSRGKFHSQIISHFRRHIFFVFLSEMCYVACWCFSEGSVTKFRTLLWLKGKRSFLITRIDKENVNVVLLIHIAIYIFLLSICCVPRSKNTFGQNFGAFFTRRHFGNLLAVQPTFHACFVPSLDCNWNKKPFHEFFRLKYMFETTPSSLQTCFNNFKLLIFFRLWCLRPIVVRAKLMLHDLSKVTTSFHCFSWTLFLNAVIYVIISETRNSLFLCRHERNVVKPWSQHIFVSLCRFLILNVHFSWAIPRVCAEGDVFWDLQFPCKKFTEVS